MEKKIVGFFRAENEEELEKMVFKFIENSGLFEDDTKKEMMTDVRSNFR